MMRLGTVAQNPELPAPLLHLANLKAEVRSMLDLHLNALSTLRRVIPALPLLIGLMATPSPGLAQADRPATGSEAAGPRCSLASLEGTYGFRFSGTVYKPDETPAASLEGAGVETFDARGRTTGGRIVGSSNGQPFSRTFSGTYMVNADCTGTKEITFDNGDQGHFFFVPVDERRQLVMIQTDPGQAVTIHLLAE
jgi:hypothetical protein